MSALDRKTREFTEIYSDYYPYIFSTVFLKISNPDDVKDICQEVFFRLYDNLEKIQNIRKWLLGTTRNVILEHYRSKHKGLVNIDDILDDVGLSFVNGFRDIRIMIQEAMDDMSNFNEEKEKLIFDLIAVYNYSYKEAGQYLGITERQVRYKYNVIVKRLIKHFNKKGIKSLDDLL